MRKLCALCGDVDAFRNVKHDTDTRHKRAESNFSDQAAAGLRQTQIPVRNKISEFTMSVFQTFISSSNIHPRLAKDVHRDSIRPGHMPRQPLIFSIRA